MNHSSDIEKWLLLNNAQGIGPVTFGRLLKFFGSVDDILGASAASLEKVEGIGPKTAHSIAASREKFNVAAELILAQALSVTLLTLQDPRYPPALAPIYDPPPVLYVKGEITRADSLAVAIVGSRRSSIYGQEQASRFAHLLASGGFTIVSGLARGVDSSAHRGAIAAKGRTIAVQGCGLNHVFPPENKELFTHITQNGAVISELPLATEPRAENFPARNRIIAALSLGTLVIEATANSGALITAKAALEYDREVMAIPGKIDSPLNAGSHKLLKQGAKLVDSIEDILETLGCVGKSIESHTLPLAKDALQKAQAPLFDRAMLNLNENEQKLFGALSKDPIHIDELIASTGFAAGPVQSSIISLQIKGLIKQLPGNLYILR